MAEYQKGKLLARKEFVHLRRVSHDRGHLEVGIRKYVASTQGKYGKKSPFLQGYRDEMNYRWRLYITHGDWRTPRISGLKPRVNEEKKVRGIREDTVNAINLMEAFTHKVNIYGRPEDKKVVVGTKDRPVIASISVYRAGDRFPIEFGFTYGLVAKLIIGKAIPGFKMGDPITNQQMKAIREATRIMWKKFRGMSNPRARVRLQEVMALGKAIKNASEYIYRKHVQVQKLTIDYKRKTYGARRR